MEYDYGRYEMRKVKCKERRNKRETKRSESNSENDE